MGPTRFNLAMRAAAAWGWGCVAVTMPAAVAQQTLIPTGANWRFFKGLEEASTPADAWRAPGFDDSAWAAGPAPFHYGQNAVGGDDGILAGTILPDMRYYYTCIFLRKAFVVTNAASVQSVRMTVNYDDGFVAWINGVEVARANFTGEPAHTALAASAHEADPAVAIALPANPAAYLVEGINVLAVQAFNNRLSTSSDFRFETDLMAVAPDPNPPVLTEIAPPPGAEVGEWAGVTVTFSEPVLGVDALDLFINGVPAASVAAEAGGTVFTFACPPPPAGPVFLDWDPAAAITDEAGNPFAATNRWSYRVLDTRPPAVVERHPAAGAEVWAFTELLVTFSEPVSGVQAADLRVNGQPAASVAGLGAGPYRFQFPAPATGTVHLAWADDHGIQDLAETPNPFAEAPWTVVLAPAAAPADVRINELVAANLSGLTDADGEPQDWIELVNLGIHPVNLLGWSLTDDPDVPGKWVFPAHELAAGQHLVVFASGKDRRQPPYHTNFKLGVFGEYLALFRPESPWTVADAFTPAFPEQRNDYAYGRDPSGAWRYYATPSPGAANGTSPIVGIAPPPHFSVSRGWFDAPFTLLLTSPLANADIRYTLDGTEPTASSGQVYSSPLAVADVTIVRAACFRSDHLPSRTVTQSYLFLDRVPYQSSTPPGYPATWGANNNFATNSYLVPADYGMDLDPLRTDPNDASSPVDPARLQRLRDGLREWPVVSLVLDPDDMFGPDGLYPNSSSGDKSDNEKPVSLEMWLPDGSTAFTIPGGLDLHGNASRDPHKNPKHGFKLSFRGDYGETSLAHPLFPDSPATNYDDLILRPDFNTSWRHWSDESKQLGEYQRRRASRTRDAFFKHTLRDMGRLASHNRYFHLFINGLYWGVYDFSEQPTADFARRYFGGTREDYDIYDQGTLRDGTSAAYNEMRSISDLANEANYERLASLLDVTEFIDYMLLHFFVGAQDWGNTKNWYAIRRRVDGPAGRFRYIPWDGENILLGETVNRVTNPDVPSGLHTKLIANPEYRLAFADRAFKHLVAPGGALTAPATIARWQYWQDVVDQAIVAESCRWGDYRRDVHRYDASGLFVLYTRETHWLPENERMVESYLPNRTAAVLNQLRSAGLYPMVDAPAFTPQGGEVSADAEVVLTAGAGTIFYTLDGSDPRQYGSGFVSPTAHLYTGPIPLAESAILRARTYDGATWSALNEAVFTVGGLGLALRISEIMYNPPGGDAYEFVEVLNAGKIPLEIGRFRFEGIGYVFPEGTVLTPGAVLLLCSGTATNLFRARYPAAPVFGAFDRALANGGERLAILDRNGRTVTAVHYDDEAGWPAAADGGGASLEVVDPLGDPNAPANWRANPYANGTPGIPPGPAASPGDVVLNEIMAHNLSAVTNAGAFPDWVEIHNRGTGPVDLGGWSLTDDSNPRRFVFPSPTVLEPGQYLRVWCDGDVAAPGLHAGFAINRAGESLFLYDPQTNLADAITFGRQIADFTIARIDSAWELAEPTPLAANRAAALAAPEDVAINEWLANPPPGEPDWLELFNRSATAPAALGGMYLGTSNAISQLPPLSFLAHLAHVQLFADEEAGPDHLEFKLPAAGGMIFLADATGQELERITYLAQATSVSEGRLPDGAGAGVAFPATASPGAANYLPDGTGPVLNEVFARNRNGAPSPWGTFVGFVELLNPGPGPADLSGMGLGRAPDDDDRWIFPPGIGLDPGETLAVWCDGTRPPAAAEDPPFNTGFAVSGDGDRIVLFDAAGQIADSATFGVQIVDRPIGLSDGVWRLLDSATPGTANATPTPLGPAADLCLNEWMADPIIGADWFEIYNPGPDPVSLGGLYVTDDPSIAGITRHPIPALSFIDAGGWVVFVADANLPAGPRYVSFGLDTLGGSLRLYTADRVLIDAIDFGAQSPGVSEGRFPDSGPEITAFPETPSPGSANHPPAVIPPTITLQPRGGVTPVGGSWTFQATVAGDLPLAFQWSADGTLLPDATNPWLTLHEVAESDSGSYTLRVTNPVGHASSDPARLTVVRPFRLEPIGYTEANGWGTILHATADVDYRLETSSNLVTWIEQAIVAQTNNLTPWFDPDTDDSPIQFYRAVLPLPGDQDSGQDP